MNQIFRLSRVSQYTGTYRVDEPGITPIEQPEGLDLFFLEPKYQNFVRILRFCSPLRSILRRESLDVIGSLIVRSVPITLAKDSGKVASSGGTHRPSGSTAFVFNMWAAATGMKPSKVDQN